MGETPEFLKQVEQAVTDWATQQESIRTLLVAGSQARSVHPADEWSDLDLEFFVTDSAAFMGEDTTWFEQFGTVWLHLDYIVDNAPQRLVIYDGGYKVDFTFFNVMRLSQLVDAQQLSDSQGRGYRVLVDKDGLANALPPAQTGPTAFEAPTEQNYQTVVTAFWYTVIYLAKQIRRRDLWIVKYRDWTLKTHLLRMVEWHCHVRSDAPIDTWHDGHFIFEWVDAMTWQELQETFDGFSATQSWRALINAVDLFRRLARETAETLDYTYPETLDANITQYIRALQRDDENANQAL